MTDDRRRFQLVNDLFQQALAMTAERRMEFLESACAEEDIRQEVRDLLKEDARTMGAMDQPALGDEIRLSKIGISPPGAAEVVPEHIGPYRVIRKLGEGGMGVVYEAEQDHPRRRVALKVMRPGFLSSTPLKRFEQESHVLGRLHHAGIAQIYDAGTCDSGAGGQPYFAMEYLEGDLLTKYVSHNGSDTRQRLELVRKICDAVHHAHVRGVIHRDLKPGNIIVQGDGQPKILDFGVARATNSDTQITTLHTDVGQLIGTLGYMSPEQVTGEPDAIDPRSDVYAIGVLMFELLAERLPVDISDRSIPEAIRIIQQQEPSRLATLSRMYRGDVDTIVSKALEKNPDRRYQSAEALSDDIGRYLRDEPIVARPAGTWYQFRKFARRNRALVAATVTIMTVLMLATAISTVFAIQRSRQRDRAVEAQDRWQHRFNDVRHLANTFMFDVDELLAPISGSTPARELLVTTALEYLDGLASEAADDAELQRELAESYLKVGDIQGNPRKPNLGATEDALASFEKARIIAEALVSRMPDDPEILLLVSNSEEKLATIYQYLRDPEQSILHGERAIEFAERALGEGASNRRASSALAAAAGVVGDTYRQMGRLEEAEPSYRRAYDVSIALDQLESSPASQRRVSVAANDLGRSLIGLERDDDAMELFTEAMSIRERLLAADPGNVRARRDLAISYVDVASILRNRGDHEESLKYYVLARNSGAAIAEDDPSNTRATQDLSVFEEKIGDALLSLDRSDEALAAYEKAVEWRRRLTEIDPANQYIKIGLAIGIERVADTLRALDRHAEALPKLEEAYGIASEVVGDDPMNALNQTAAFMMSSKLGLVCETIADASNDADRRAHLRAAIDWYQKGVSHREDAERREVRLLAQPDVDPVTGLERCEAAIENEVAADSNEVAMLVED